VLEDEDAGNARFDKKLEQEEIWIRQGIKARRTRNEGRARALATMREERANRIGRESGARIHIEQGEQSGRKVIRAKNVNYSFDEQPLIENFSIKIMRGDRIGILGNNGVGKTTLLRLLLKDVEPQSGTIKHGTNLKIGYFDQMRESLDLEKSVAENVGDGRTYIRMNGKDRHVIGYLKGFLFSPKRAMTPVKSLSGGERNRIILAKLFTKPANLLILDEPTNDLDMETLEVLEQKLTEYQGTLIVVSHDREFLDNVVTSTVVFEENAQVREYVGGYSDWLRQGRELAELDRPDSRKSRSSAEQHAEQGPRPEKLSYKEMRDLEQLPLEIDAVESRIGELQQAIAKPDFYATGQEQVQQVLANLNTAEKSLEALIDRWGALAEKQQRYEASRPG